MKIYDESNVENLKIFTFEDLEFGDLSFRRIITFVCLRGCGLFVKLPNFYTTRARRALMLKDTNLIKKFNFLTIFLGRKGCYQTKYQTITSYTYLKSFFYKEQLLVYENFN